MKLFSRRIKRVNASAILVKFSKGKYQGRIQTSINFEDNYVDALRSALNAVRSGCTDVSVIQYRERIHSHSELYAASYYLGRHATDEEVIEQVHHFSSLPPNPNLIRLLDSVGSSISTIWAVAS
jgi:hypothetical protein